MFIPFSKASIFLYSIRNITKIRDRYDLESIDNILIKRIVKKFKLNNLAYSLGLIRTYSWPENIRMLCEAAAELSMMGEFEHLLELLFSEKCIRGGWGLPVPWHSGDYHFPKGTMMSTTTAEICDSIWSWHANGLIDENYSDVHSKLLTDMKNNLNISHKDKEAMIFSYTPLDQYKIINSNLLIASALAKDANNRFEYDVLKILNGVRSAVGSTGKFTYFYEGGRIDSYHQIFCLKALFDLSDNYPIAKIMFEEGFDYLTRELIDEDGRVFVTPDKLIIDLHGVADSLSLLRKIGDNVMYEKIYKACQNTLIREGSLYQYAKPNCQNDYKVFTPAYGRQGYLRMMLAIN